MKKHWLVIFTFIVLLAACATTPVKDISIDSDADPKANFSGYKTYTWLGSAAIVNDSSGLWEPPSFDADSEVKFLIDRELRGRGMSENDADPDLIVAFALAADMDALVTKVDPKTKLEILDNVPQGGLVIELIDSDTGYVIWVGVATAEVQQNPSDETIKARLDYAVSKLLKQIPK